MADTQTTVALNIGSQRISMAVFEVSKNGGLVLKAYDSESIVADPSMDASRISQTRVAIADLAQRLKVGKIESPLRDFRPGGFHPLRQTAAAAG